MKRCTMSALNIHLKYYTYTRIMIPPSLTEGWEQVPPGLTEGWEQVPPGLTEGWQQVPPGLAEGWEQVCPKHSPKILYIHSHNDRHWINYLKLSSFELHINTFLIVQFA